MTNKKYLESLSAREAAALLVQKVCSIQEQLLDQGDEMVFDKNIDIDAWFKGSTADALESWFVAERQQCKVCGCTEDRACPGGCYWAEDNLCSKCAERDNDSGGAK